MVGNDAAKDSQFVLSWRPAAAGMKLLFRDFMVMLIMLACPCRKCQGCCEKIFVIVFDGW
jgi:hypothetical protein